MPVLTLCQLARKACIKNVNSIMDIGDAEYSLVRPVLLKLQNPKQLYQLEQNCPQIIGADAEIWMEFCKRDIPSYENNPQEPANPQNWYKCYQKLFKAGQKEIDADAAALKATMDIIKNKQAENKAQQVELRGVKVPSGLKKNIPTIALPKGSSVYHGMGRSREYSRDGIEKGPPKVVSTLAKIRKETAAHRHLAAGTQLQHSSISPREMKLRPAPTKSTIMAAPRYLVEKHQKAKIPEPVDPSVQPCATFNPKKRRIEHVENEAGVVLSGQEAREKRLRALTNPLGVGSSLSSTISPTTDATKSSTPPPNVNFPHGEQLANASSSEQSPSKSHNTTNLASSTNSSPSHRMRSTPSSPQIRPIMRVKRGPVNPLITPKRRPIPQSS